MRKIERHISNQGSVVTFDMYGKEVNLFVADAKYRAVKEWGLTEGKKLKAGNFTDDFKAINPNAPYDNDAKALTYDMDDAKLQARFPSFKADKTAKENTDALMQFLNTEAAHWCRGIELEGAGALDLPTVYEAMVIYLEADRLDALDPTANEYKHYALGTLNPNGRFDINDTGCVLTSTRFFDTGARCVDSNGGVGYSNACNGVVPVKEL